MLGASENREENTSEHSGGNVQGKQIVRHVGEKFNRLRNRRP